MNQLRLKQIQHFFEHYKDLEAGKWVKIMRLGRPGGGAPGDPRRDRQLCQAGRGRLEPRSRARRPRPAPP